MDSQSLGNTHHRPPLPQRAVSQSGLQYHNPAARSGLPSHLTTVRSASQPLIALDLTADGATPRSRNSVSFSMNQESIVRAPDVIEVQDAEFEPSAKRAKTEGPEFRPDDDTTHDGGRDRAHERRAGSPLPAMPKHHSIKQRTMRHRSRSQKADPKRRANGTDPPPMATRLPIPEKVADFSPWTGRDHPEDVMNEAVVKAGYYDKGTGTNQNESSSAKPSIWPNLSQKNNTGLQMVAYLFTQVLEKRQLLGKCTAAPTFKPPPRVTVTDTKREAWLRDLANTEVPLRKQSRTIPHGVRGKGLMDQCLAKQIPPQRAVWLAKCVGANELRAYRRKGVSGPAAASGEIKWVREWTVQIEQFLEGVIATCGQSDWQRRMNYAVKLATSFFAEKLMDIDHYLDWIISSFGSATSDVIPIWIVMVQLYWKHLVSFVRRGRRLAGYLLERLRLSVPGGSAGGNAIHLRLQKLVTVLATTNRGCLVIPGSWETFKHLLTPNDESSDLEAPLTLTQNIAQRNERFAAPLHKVVANPRGNLLELYTLLDSVGMEFDITDLAAQVLSIIPETVELVSALITWASSRYRQGQSRIYLTASIIATLSSQGCDTDTAVLISLGDTSDSAACQIDNIHAVVVDLVRRNKFSTGRYLQWLITSGGLSGDGSSKRATGLLAVLPVDTLPQQLLNTRSTLLRRLNVQSLRITPEVLAEINLEAILDGEEQDTKPFRRLIQNIGSNSRMEVAAAIRRAIRERHKQFDIRIGPFCTFRDALEHVADPATLSELLHAVMASDDSVLLSSVADTINYHAKTFTALGVADELVNSMTERYRVIRSLQALDRTFIHGMLALAKRMLRRNPLQKLLENDLAICEQQSLLAACSPASDNLSGMHASSLVSDNDVDAVFASGNSMDQHLMQRVFLRIVHHATEASPPQPETPSKICSWLNQLRLLDAVSFDHLARTYIQTFFQDSPSLVSTDAVTALVASGCCSLADVVDAARGTSSVPVAVTIVKLVLSPQDLCVKLSAAEQYRYKVTAQAYSEAQTAMIVDLICQACETLTFFEDMSSLFNLAIDYCLRNPAATAKLGDRRTDSSTLQPSTEPICQAILKRGHPGFTNDSMDPAMVLSLADPLSIKFCAWALRMLTASQSAEGDKIISELLIQTIDDGNCVWPQLVDGVGHNIRKVLHEWAQDQLLIYASGRGPDEDVAVQEVIQRYLDVLDITHDAVQAESDTAVVATLTEKLKALEKHLDGISARTGELNDLQGALRSLQLFLHICILHVKGTSESDSSRQARGTLLTALCSLLTLPSLQTHRDVLEYIFDLAATLAEGLTETSFTSTTRASLTSLSHDHRVRSILGGLGLSPTAVDSWLALSSQPYQIQPVGAVGGLQQQRSTALLKANTRAAADSPSQQLQQQKSWLGRGVGPVTSGSSAEARITPYTLRPWEIMPDPTPVMGENDGSLSLGLFGARKM